MGLGISVFLSIYITVAAMVLIIIYLIWVQKLKDVALYTPGIQYLWALCALGIVAAYENNNTVGVLIALALVGCFIVGAFARSVMTRTLFDKFAAVSCGASVFSFAVALIQYLIYSERISSVFINANYYAAITEIVVLLAVYKLFNAQGFWKKGFYTAVILLNIAGLYLSGCRTAVFALFAAVSLMLMLYRRFKTLAAFWAFCVLAAGVIFLLPGIFPRMEQIGTDMGTRLDIWHRALMAISAHPLFGEGALAFTRFHLTLNGMHIIHAHSIYLETILCFGVVGVALILAYLKNNLTPIWRMRRSPRDRDTFALALGLFASVALHGAVDATPFNVQTGVLLMLGLAIAGIQENLQPALMRMPAYRMAFLPSGEAGQARRDVDVAEEKPYFPKRSI